MQTFDLSWLSPLLIFISVCLCLGRKEFLAGQLGRVAIGLVLILLTLELIVSAATPITQANDVKVLFFSLTCNIFLDALTWVLFTIISYSSLALALLNAALETLRMGDVMERMLLLQTEVLHGWVDKNREVRPLDVRR